MWHRLGTGRRSAGQGVGPWRHLTTAPQQPRRFSPRTGPGVGIAVGRLAVWGRLSCRAGGWEAAQVGAIAWPGWGLLAAHSRGLGALHHVPGLQRVWVGRCHGGAAKQELVLKLKGVGAPGATCQLSGGLGGLGQETSGWRVPSEELCCRSSHRAAGEGSGGAPHSSGVLLHPGCSGPLPFQPPGGWASGEHVACRVWGQPAVACRETASGGEGARTRPRLLPPRAPHLSLPQQLL